MSRMCAGDRYASKKFLLLALLLCYVSSANCFYNPFSSKAVVDQSAREVGSSRGNVTARSWHSDSDALSNSTAKGLRVVFPVLR
ncbi:UNVERIFIED_CONTAM: hypothetical protein PYX00_009876 [Menopon gallinae]|uniref:Secreted protein n=1 Tax=Menopon gallinae TaxID=328185 RepID=A0AAW2HDC4_9NEOP